MCKCMEGNGWFWIRRSEDKSLATEAPIPYDAFSPYTIRLIIFPPSLVRSNFSFFFSSSRQVIKLPQVVLLYIIYCVYT